MDNSIGVLGTSEERSKYDMKLQDDFKCGQSIEKFKVVVPPPKCPPCPPTRCPPCPPCPKNK